MALSRRWEEAETQYLLELAGTYTIDEIYKKHRRECKRLGLEPRTKKAIKSRFKCLGMSTKPWLDNFNRRNLSELLGVSHYVVTNWCKKGYLKSRRYKNQWLVTRKDLEEMAWEHPGKLQNADLDGLVFLFEEELVDHILAHRGTEKTTQKVKVRHRRTGKVYPSIAQAAKANYYSHWTIRKYLKIGKDWERV